MQCTAKSKQSGEQCKKSAIVGKNKCAIHGGKSRSGFGSSTFKHGRYSKALPAHLMANYTQALADPQLLSLNEEVALCDARVAELMGRLGTGESLVKWESLQAYHADLIKAMRAGDGPALKVAAQAIGEIAHSAATDVEAWREINATIEQRRKLVESELKHRIAMRETLTVEEVMTLIMAVTASLKKHVGDRAILAAIGVDMERILNYGGSDDE